MTTGNRTFADFGIRENLAKVYAAIAQAAERSGRSAKAVTLIAVSKTKTIEMIGEAAAAGQKSFGENYVQEAIPKVSARPDLDWHFIGSLQTNKVKQVVGRFSLIHSVDRLRLAEELSQVAVKNSVTQDVLVQVHVGEEATKHGVSLDEVPDLIAGAANLPGLRLRGVMSLPPLTDSEKQARLIFSQLREGFQRWRTQCLTSAQADCFSELSMGTSSDFEWAILEGATMVRVGTSIFGAREGRI